MAQTSYSYKTPNGHAGLIYDISMHVVETRRNENADGEMHFGVGVVKGTTAGEQVKLPTSASVAADFEGVTLNGETTEFATTGAVTIRNDAALSVLTKGKVWVKVTDGAVPAYGATAYLVVSGTDAGKFTSDTASGIDVGAKFATAKDNGLAVIVL